MNLTTTLLFVGKPVVGGISASEFVGRTQGRLRDFYRIGKVLGTGKLA